MQLKPKQLMSCTIIMPLVLLFTSCTISHRVIHNPPPFHITINDTCEWEYWLLQTFGDLMERTVLDTILVRVTQVRETRWRQAVFKAIIPDIGGFMGGERWTDFIVEGISPAEVSGSPVEYYRGPDQRVTFKCNTDGIRYRLDPFGLWPSVYVANTELGLVSFPDLKTPFAHLVFPNPAANFRRGSLYFNRDPKPDQKRGLLKRIVVPAGEFDCLVWNRGESTEFWSQPVGLIAKVFQQKDGDIRIWVLARYHP